MAIVESTTGGGRQVTKTYYRDGTVAISAVNHDVDYTYEARDAVRKKKDKGWRYPTSYSMLHRFVRHSTGTWSIDIPGGDPFRIERTGIMAPQYDTSYQGPTSVAYHITSDALLKAMLKTRNLKLDIGPFIGEAKKTASMVTDAAMTIYKTVKALKKGNFSYVQSLTGWGKPRKPAPEIGDLWLQYRYGWTPLLHDVYNSCELLAEAYHGQRPVTATGLSWEPLMDEVVVGGGGEYSRFLSTAGIQSSFVRFDFSPSNTLGQAVQSLGLDNPLAIAWELAPWSFVGDWFLPIGNALGAADYASNINWISGSQSDWIDCVTRTTSDEAGSYQGVSVAVSGSYAYTKLVRVPFVSPPNVPLPGFRNPFPHGPRMLDAIALMRQAFRT